ncbi:MAG: hypothetical protein JWQ38_3355 [Flavipsychrobacter sp.]|nr:hypothetical protein [Flavipsychrobacter sp.]
MKTTKIITGLALLVLASFTSCKKNYTCTCTTVVASVSVTDTHGIDNATYTDAKKECNNYEDQANASYPGGTTCHL